MISTHPLVYVACVFVGSCVFPIVDLDATLSQESTLCTYPLIYISVYVPGLGIVERVSPIEYIKRLLLMRSALGDSSIELGINTVMHMLPESSRDCRHTGDLYWHGYYQMNKLSPSELLILTLH